MINKMAKPVYLVGISCLTVLICTVILAYCLKPNRYSFDVSTYAGNVLRFDNEKGVVKIIPTHRFISNWHVTEPFSFYSANFTIDTETMKVHFIPQAESKEVVLLS